METEAEIENKSTEKEELTIKTTVHPQLRIRLCTDEPVFGPGTICLLKLIRQCGSMKEACQMMDMSYSKGWKIIAKAEKGMGYSLIHRRHGGKQGGRCTLTDEAKSLVERYELLENAVKKKMEERFLALFPEF